LIIKTHEECDLTNQKQIETLFVKENPEYVILCAAKVGGIQANINNPATLLGENLTIQTNVIHQAYKSGVKKIIYFGSACSYPKESNQPMKEEYLLDGKPEPTNEYYAIAKIAGLKMCEAFNKQYGTNIYPVIFTNLYGPNDNFHPQNSHVIPALILKIHQAKVKNEKQVELWGSGRPLREFLFVDDAVDACIFLLNRKIQPGIINIGSSKEISIISLAENIKKIVGYQGSIVIDSSKPDGSERKLLDSSKINELGWKSTTGIEEGLKKTYHWFLTSYSKNLEN